MANTAHFRNIENTENNNNDIKTNGHSTDMSITINMHSQHSRRNKSTRASRLRVPLAVIGNEAPGSRVVVVVVVRAFCARGARSDTLAHALVGPAAERRPGPTALPLATRARAQRIGPSGGGRLAPWSPSPRPLRTLRRSSCGS